MNAHFHCPLSPHCSVVKPNPTINYLGNQTVNQISSTFPSRDITYSFTKTQSSSTVHNASLFVYLPVYVDGRRDGEDVRYYLYPAAVSMHSVSISPSLPPLPSPPLASIPPLFSHNFDHTSHSLLQVLIIATLCMSEFSLFLCSQRLVVTTLG